MLKKIRVVIVCIILIFVFFGMFGLAVLQDSYRKSPPSAAERAEHPVLISFLVGGE